jgi:hypothetical protein
VRYIRENSDVGSTDDPSDYFEDTLEMQWGPYFANENIVYFAGRTKTTNLALCGSMKNVIGKAEATIGGYSSAPDFLRALAQDAELADVATGEPAADARSNAMALHVIAITTPGRYAPFQRLEFLAKRLLSGPDYNTGKTLLLGSPLYVALAE